MSLGRFHLHFVGTLLAYVVVLGAPLLLACGDDSAAPVADAGPEGDGFFFDGGAASDAGMGLDSGQSIDDETLPPSPLDNAFNRAMSPARCVAMGEGCADPTCLNRSQTCCTGRADCCAAPEMVRAYDWATCTDSACLEGMAGFGAPAYRIEGAFFPGGDGDYDSGASFDEVFDLREVRVQLEASFAPPSEACGSGRCIDSVAVGLTAQAPLASRAHVQPIAALVWVRGEMLLQVQQRIVHRWPSEGGTWRLEVDAQGDVRVVAPDESIDALFPGVVAMATAAQVIVYGHNTNPGVDVLGARLHSLSVSTERCETTRQWRDREAVELVRAALEEPLQDAFAPTVLHDGTRLWAAYLAGGAVHLTQRPDELVGHRWVRTERSDPALDPTAFGTSLTTPVLRSPELLMEGGRLSLLIVVGEQLYRLSLLEDGRHFGNPIAIPHSIAVGAVSVVTRTGGAAALVVRQQQDTGRDRLVALSLVGEQLRTYSVLPTEQLGEAFGDPAIFLRNGLYQVYVPYRRGTRWRLAHLVSEDFLHWRVADLAAMEGEGAGERTGPRAPAVATLASGEGIELFYERFDGVRHGVGRALRMAPQSAQIRSR